MDSSTQKTLYSEPAWFFRHHKDDAFKSIRVETVGIILQNKNIFSELELDEQLMRNFLAQNQDVMQLVEIPESLRYRPRSPLLASFIATLLGRFVKDCKYHVWRSAQPIWKLSPLCNNNLLLPI
ncbi:hypothetical protein RclHR1_00360031 [Rhizophagus clarus]|uniref:Uncharacterized protein n=1 Tax=Rhizophagus clarus TaxID=94130 RepID=A0A2Z6RF97_9GLOM|nr:hypothetical protein RclHR1_00360031 [Rhizophagus clarus]